MNDKGIDYYLALPYTIEVILDSDDEYGESWFARVLELPGCMTEADTFAELGEMIRDAMTVWIEDALQDGDTVPEPRPVDDYSGKFVVRVSRSLHRDLAQRAEREGISLNAWISQVLAQGVVVGETLAAQARTEPKPDWAALSNAAYRALVYADHRVEAEEVTEKYFARWIGDQLAQARACLQSGRLEEARSYLEECHIALRPSAELSPLMEAFRQGIDVLDEAMQRQIRLIQGTGGEDFFRQRASMHVREESSVFEAIIRQSTEPRREGRPSGRRPEGRK